MVRRALPRARLSVLTRYAETTAQFLARGLATFKEKMGGMDDEVAAKFRADLEKWREAYRAECAKDDIANEDRYKVVTRLLVQLQNIVRTSSQTAPAIIH